MFKYLFVVLFLSTAIVSSISAQKQCFKAGCYYIFPNYCPPNTHEKSRDSCGVLSSGKNKICCPNYVEHIDESASIWPSVSMPSTSQNSYRPQGSSTNRPNLPSPRVRSISWGHVMVEGMTEHFKDIKLFPGGAKTWDWRETNTRHQPGIQPADLRELFEKDCQIIILSSGIQNMLNTKDETRDELARRGMRYGQDYFILQSEEAVRVYNQYVDQGERVCAVIHSTC